VNKPFDLVAYQSELAYAIRLAIQFKCAFTVRLSPGTGGILAFPSDYPGVDHMKALTIVNPDGSFYPASSAMVDLKEEVPA
jgi:hypothetical protein